MSAGDDTSPGPLQGSDDPRIALFDLTGHITGLHNNCHRIHNALLAELCDRDPTPVFDPTLAEGIRLDDIRHHTARDLGIADEDDQ
ncbi:hypothetical protein [Pseudonocardia parietis]|uniref:Uncharacterized protein n=1 Tax=Pseudonocardia parietis TaxID=570936 RepID=A0ABS4W233_9PSEU|nr:hypothetical protein [Pseudonocardia parietis]MBP2370265.1 hypothetical protein [Pseudonocardia parietis]